MTYGNRPHRTEISQLQAPAKSNYERIRNLQKFTIHNVTLFNIWDAISFIYTMCVQDVKTPVEAQLHLVQFRLIIKSLSAEPKLFSRLLHTPAP